MEKAFNPDFGTLTLHTNDGSYAGVFNKVFENQKPETGNQKPNCYLFVAAMIFSASFSNFGRDNPLRQDKLRLRLFAA